METLKIYALGSKGVNTDLSELHKDELNLSQSQNAISDPLGYELALTKRPGLAKFNASAAAGAVLGGVGVPLLNFVTGTHYFLIARSPKS